MRCPLSGCNQISSLPGATRMPRPASFILGAGLMFAISLGLARHATAAPVQLHVESAIPRFLSFYHQATSKQLSPSQRWNLWKKTYGIAAVPPTTQGQALAHKRLNQVWSRYAGIVGQLPGKVARAKAAAKVILPQVAHLLHSGKHSIDVDLMLFVGEFSDNAFTAPGRDGKPTTVYLPVEMSFSQLRITLAHEFTHAVHKELDHLTGRYVEPLGATVLKEGLAMRVSQHIVPGHATTAYTPGSKYGPSWQKTCRTKQKQVVRSMLPYLSSATEATTQRFTYGEGTVGMHDQVYCAGWILIDKLLSQGYSYAAIARIPQKKMPQFVETAINRLFPDKH